MQRSGVYEGEFLTGVPRLKGARSDSHDHRAAVAIARLAVRQVQTSSNLSSQSVLLAVTCLADGDGGGENICSADLQGQIFS